MNVFTPPSVSNIPHSARAANCVVAVTCLAAEAVPLTDAEPAAPSPATALWTTADPRRTPRVVAAVVDRSHCGASDRQGRQRCSNYAHGGAPGCARRASAPQVCGSDASNRADIAPLVPGPAHGVPAPEPERVDEVQRIPVRVPVEVPSESDRRIDRQELRGGGVVALVRIARRDPLPEWTGCARRTSPPA